MIFFAVTLFLRHPREGDQGVDIPYIGILYFSTFHEDNIGRERVEGSTAARAVEEITGRTQNTTQLR